MLAQSPTSLQKFLTCPRQYEATYITKEVKFSESAHTRFGSLIHKCIEDYLKGSAPLPDIFEPVKPIFDKMKVCLIGAETKFAVTKSGEPTEFFSKDAYQRCIVDALVGNPDSYIVCVDWKTGKKRDAQTQHDFIKKCVKAKYPNAKIITLFIYLFTGESDRQEYNGEELPALANNMQRLETALLTGVFEPVRSGLCGKWCDVLSCEYNGKNK